MFSEMEENYKNLSLKAYGEQGTTMRESRIFSEGSLSFSVLFRNLKKSKGF